MVLSNENVIHVKKSGIEKIQFRRLIKEPGLIHAYTIKTSGLNFKSYGNNATPLKQSFEKISKEFGFKVENLIKPHQTHTNRVERVDSSNQKFNEVDGLVTNIKDIALITTSADCTSLLFYSPSKKVVASVHSGWRGTIQKICQKAVIKMVEEYECKPEDIICCICPCIQRCHFEVEGDVEKVFRETFEYTGKIEEIIKKGRIIERTDGKQGIEQIQKYNIDTTYVNELMLKEVGLKPENIINSKICTVCNSKYFHSHRADRQTDGRNGAIIGLK